MGREGISHFALLAGVTFALLTKLLLSQQMFFLFDPSSSLHPAENGLAGGHMRLIRVKPQHSVKAIIFSLLEAFEYIMT